MTQISNFFDIVSEPRDMPLYSLPLVRQLKNSKWENAKLFLELHPDIDEVEVTPRHGEWRWYLQRVNKTDLFIQKTYLGSKLVLISHYM
jgi:hypothetical protein